MEKGVLHEKYVQQQLLGGCGFIQCGVSSLKTHETCDRTSPQDKSIGIFAIHAASVFCIWRRCKTCTAAATLVSNPSIPRNLWPQFCFHILRSRLYEWAILQYAKVKTYFLFLKNMFWQICFVKHHDSLFPRIPWLFLNLILLGTNGGWCYQIEIEYDTTQHGYQFTSKGIRWKLDRTKHERVDLLIEWWHRVPLI